MHTDSASSPSNYFNPLRYRHDGGTRRWLMLGLVLLLSIAITSGAFGRAQAQTEPIPVDQSHDLGDAPDNTNHHGLENLAYPGIPGRFPTVWEGNPPSGPLHHDITLFWLGDRITPEFEADKLPDADGETNILDNGAADVADRDRADDGWLNRDATFANCTETKLKVRVSWSGPVRDLDLLYINAWYDGQGDGDWDDQGECPNGKSSEWIIQNATWNNPSFGATSYVDIDLGTVLVHNPKEDDAAWLRLTLSERPVESWDALVPDGRGPPASNNDVYRLGETEDYLIEPATPQLKIEKTANVTSVLPGGEIEYTIVIANGGTAPANGVTMIDPIPSGTSFVAGSENATAPTVVYDAGNNWIKWGGNIPASSSVTIKFKVKVSDDVECQSIIRNRAALVRRDLSVIQEATAEVHVECQPQDILMDLGDAPDSTNHFGLANTAYAVPGTLGRYPTVWEGNPPSGPAHQILYWLWLGEQETREKDADLLPDGDGLTNILDNGAADVANKDRADDGWLNPDVALDNCQQAKLKVRISKAATATTLQQAYLNVWFDGNRDGDWNDTGQCPSSVGIAAPSYEWIVQDFVVNAAAIPASGFLDIEVPTELIYSQLPSDLQDQAAWLRFTLSEQPAVKPASGGLPDGRGLDFPARFRFGETEDYIQRREIQGEPKLEIHKKANVSSALIGDTIVYTVEVQNTGTTAASGVMIVDPIPAGTTYVTGSATSTPAGVSYNSSLQQIEWTGSIPGPGVVTITFKVQVNRDNECGAVIKNVATVQTANGPQIPSEGVLVRIECDPNADYTDLGDAPHSRSNHYTMDNTAYTGVLGRFPTVWNTTPPTEPSGPLHSRADLYWLGNRVTAEEDADMTPDADPRTNILDNGAADVADNDRADDGWLNPDAPLDDCRETTLGVRVSRAAFATLNGKLYLNVWFDGNRDGDWQDTGECIFDNQRKAGSFEWIVQNWTIDPNSIPAGGFIDIKVPTRLVYNAKPDAAAWMRFTLSEQPAVKPATGLPDGRGPQQPATFRTGETEDYLRPGKQQGEPGQISIDKTAQTSTSPVNVGDIIEYSVYVAHSGGTAPASTSMVDQLPAEVVLVGPPVVTELTPSAAPLVASFNPGSGPNGAVEWSGTLSPGAVIRIDFEVRVRYCPPNGVIQNIAVAHQVDGSEIKATADVKVECTITTPGVELQKHIIIRDGQTISQVVSSPIVGNNVLGYVLRLSSTDGVSHTVMVSDTLPTGITAVSANASSGVASIMNSGQAVQWTGEIGPANSPVEIRIRIQLADRIECDQRLINVAKWITRQHSGLSNEVVLWLACSDLGDAPDSTNNAGAAMLAYPGTGARYPTVFNVAAPERGPKHLLPRPFHLGRGVTAEAEADLGFDQDGVNNIRPAANTPNLDKRDDGLLAPSTFAHCRINTMQIRVSISPAAVAFFGQNKGYLNVWVDSNRDGDWADELDCPQVLGGNFQTALEHIVIDHIVDVAALGAGVHDLTVVTTSPVHYPTSINQRAWLRITLSERPSNKPLSASGPGHSNYGDGRGYDDAFRYGETEDYLLPAPSQQEQADPSVEKHGRIWPNYDPATNQRRWMIGWIINYANAGPAAATNVHVVDTYDPPQTLVSEHSVPLVPHTQSGNTLDYNVGTLAAGGSGIVIIRTAVPWTTTPGTILNNEATISSDNDGDSSNNSSTASVRVPILPPLITSPLAGTTCTETVNVSGQAQVGVTVDLYVDGSLAASLPTDAAGNWSTSLTLPDGGHDIYAVAKMGAMTSAPSPTVHIIVDSSLFWDPISLRFTDSSGQVIIPSGRLDESGWSIFLRPGHTYVVSLRICCEDPNAQVTLEIGDLLLTLTDPDGDRIYTATFTIPAGGRFTGTVRICVTCGLIRRCSDGTVLIDPEGTVFNVVTGQPIDGANVACLQEIAGDGTSTFELWPASSFDQENAQTVGADGYYSFFTPPGAYQVEVTKEGYQSHRSPNLVVTDTPVHYDVPLTPNVSEDADQLIAITNGGFEPAVVTVEPGSVIEWVNAGEAAHSTISMPNVLSAAQGGENWDSGLLNTGETYKRTLAAEGTYSYQDATDPSITGTIIVKKSTVTEPEPTAKEIFLPLVKKQ